MSKITLEKLNGPIEFNVSRRLVPNLSNVILNHFGLSPPESLTGGPSPYRIIVAARPSIDVLSKR